MSKIVGVIDLGQAGNIHSILKALHLADSSWQAQVIHNSDQIKKVDKIILPGVGAFPNAMSHLSPLKEELAQFVICKDLLGICLGMQILGQIGYEFQETSGLGLISGETRKIIAHGRIPHIGWSKVSPIANSPLFKETNHSSFFYFMHSFELVNYTDVVALSRYCSHEFVASVHRDHVFGVQFHPEKSREQGIQVFQNFLNL